VIGPCSSLLVARGRGSTWGDKTRKGEKKKGGKGGGEDRVERPLPSLSLLLAMSTRVKGHQGEGKEKREKGWMRLSNLLGLTREQVEGGKKGETAPMLTPLSFYLPISRGRWVPMRKRGEGGEGGSISHLNN